jgi:hypothetical protein
VLIYRVAQPALISILRAITPFSSCAQGEKKLAPERLVFRDEFSINTAMTRTHARAPIGERAEVVEPFNPGSNISCIGAISLTGFHAPMMHDD